jgi:CubicO group peptidase (beta-lactamase class C family)
MSKPITAAATMILVEECKIRLDDAVEHWLPELAERHVLQRFDGPLDETMPAHRPITVRDLLTFRMGFGQIHAAPDAYPILRAANELQIGMGPPSPSSMPAPDEWIRRLGQLPLMYQPGERWMYNTGSDVLSVLIARASGQDLPTFLHERLFEPLGMQDTGFSVPQTALDRFGNCYWNDSFSGKMVIFDKAEGGQWNHPPAFPSGAGGLVSTVDDYLAFAQMMLNQGKHGSERILSRLSVETMTTDQLTPAQKTVSGLVPDFFDSHGWGFGVSIVTKRDGISAVPGRYGWDGGLGTSWYSDPTEDIITILMTPRAWSSPNPPDICRDFWTLAYLAIDD